MRVKSLLCVFFLLLMAGGVFAQVQTGSAYPKREFRAAWIQSETDSSVECRPKN